MRKLLGIISGNKTKKGFPEIQAGKRIVYRNVSVFSSVENKFNNDSVFFENEDYIVVTGGVILNKNLLLKAYSERDLISLIISRYNKTGSRFFEIFKGSFCGFFYDKKKDIAIVFTNQFGDKQIFYHYSEDGFIFGSDLKDISNLLSGFSLSERGAYSLLSYGFMLESLTLVNEIEKLRAGHSLIFEKGKLQVRKYWDFDNTIFTRDKEEAIIENIDILFKEAIDLEYGKDLEYNYKHLSTLSAGLDSRMNVWVANEMGYTNQTNLTFSKSGYIDNTVAQKIADDLKNPFVFLSLTGKNFFNNFEDVTKINFGNCFITGIIHVYNSFKRINSKDFGLCHTGQLGDVVVGTYNKTPQHQPVQKLSGSFSKFLKEYIPETSDTYINNEHFMMQQRGFNGILQGNLTFQESTEVSSPFMDKDFFEYCMSIPPDLRFNHRIYLKWIKKKHSEAGNYIWEKILAKPNCPALSYKRYYFPLSNFWNIRTALLPRVRKELNARNPKIVNKNNMNPYQYWYNSNYELQKELTLFYETEKFRLEKYPELLKNVQKMFFEGGFTEKSQVISLLSAIKYIW